MGVLIYVCLFASVCACLHDKCALFTLSTKKEKGKSTFGNDLQTCFGNAICSKSTLCFYTTKSTLQGNGEKFLISKEILAEL